MVEPPLSRQADVEAVLRVIIENNGHLCLLNFLYRTATPRKAPIGFEVFNPGSRESPVTRWTTGTSGRLSTQVGM